MKGFLHSIKSKYFLTMALVLLCPIILLNILSTQFTLNRLVQNKLENQSRLIQSFRDALFNRHINDMEHVLRELGSDRELWKITTDSEVEQRILQNWDFVRSLYPERAWIYFGDHQNRIMVSPYWEADENYDVKQRPWYQNALTKEGVVWSKPFTEYVSGKYVLTVSMEIFDENEISRGVFAIDTFLDQFLDLFLMDIQNHQEILLMVDNDNKVMASNYRNFQNESFPEYFYYKHGSPFVKIGMKNYYFTDLSIPNLSWRMISLLPETELLAETKSLRNTQRSFLLFSVIIAAGVSYIFSMIIIRKLNRINFFMDRVGQGNLEISIPETGKDEFSQLSHHLNRTVRQLSYSQESAKSLTRLLSHSISNALASMDQRLLRMMDHPALGEGCRMELENMEQEILSTQLFIQNTTLARTENLQEFLLSDEVSELEDILSLLKERLKRRASIKGQNIITFNPLGRVQIRGNQLLILHSLDNLCDNAIKFSPLGESIEIAVIPADTSLIIEVGDHGPGIAEEELPNIFDESFKKSNHPTGGETSHGIGLSVTKKVMNALSGDLRCIKREGYGGVFQMEIPLAALKDDTKDSDD